MVISNCINVNLPVDVDHNCSKGYPKQLLWLLEDRKVLGEFSRNQNHRKAKSKTEDYSPDHNLKWVSKREHCNYQWKTSPDQVRRKTVADAFSLFVHNLNLGVKAKTPSPKGLGVFRKLSTTW
jgi:hypothetical protein